MSPYLLPFVAIYIPLVLAIRIAVAIMNHRPSGKTETQS